MYDAEGDVSHVDAIIGDECVVVVVIDAAVCDVGVIVVAADAAGAAADVSMTLLVG